MDRKYIFIDLDGTIIDHSTNTIPESTKMALKLLKENGHEIIISTGRPPSLFSDITKLLNVDSYIASNGRIVVYQGEQIVDDFIDKEVVKELVRVVEENNIDLAFESLTDYVLNSNHTSLAAKFNDLFHIKHPETHRHFHLENDIYQMVLFYTETDYKKFEEMFPTLSFHYSNEYGLDVNEKGGMKDLGVRAIVEKLNIDIKDTIAVGDGFNDISMIEYSHLGVAMGNAYESLKEVADMITDSVENDGIYNLFKKLNMI